MKNRYITYAAMLGLGLHLLSACSDEFLEVKPRGLDLEANYYLNAEQAYSGLVAAYDPIGWVGSDLVTKVGAVNSASDDHYAGGGNATDVNAYQVWSNYTLDAANGPQATLWSKGYSGVFRANVLLSKLPDVPMDQQLKTRFDAEARFLRAYYYFDLIRLFERIPLITEPIAADQWYNIVQEDREAVFKQIEDDLLAAIPGLPLTVVAATEAGRASQGTAKALLGKVYLEQGKCELAAGQLKDVNGTPGGTSQYGYRLLPNFGDLWDPGNKFNSESIMEVSHTSTSNAGWGCIPCTEGNVLNQMMGPRDYRVLQPGPGVPNYVAGWSFNVPTLKLVEAFKLPGGAYDPRYRYSITNVDSLEKAGRVEYGEAAGYMNTGYFVAKFSGRVEHESTGGGDKPLNWGQNMYEIRLADAYLMEAEALLCAGTDPARAQQLLDAVRARVGLAAVPVSLDNILHERRVELAAEGHRWFDLVRSGRAAAALADRGFVAGKHNKLPIPLLELNNTKLVQDPAYQ